MKKTFLFSLFLFYPLILSAKDTTLVIDTDFHQESESFFVGKGETGKAKIDVQNGKYIIENTTNGNNSSWFYSIYDFNRNDDFVLETKIRKRKGVENYAYGLILGYRKDKKNYYKLGFSGNGMYTFYGYWNDKNQNIFKWTRSNLINQIDEWNDIKLVKNGGILNVYLNGDTLFSYNAFYPQDFRYGFFMDHGGMELEIDYFRINSYPFIVDEIEYLPGENIEKYYPEIINTTAIEMSPYPSPDGKTLYFIRKNHPENTGTNKDHEDIWFSKYENGNLSKPEIMPPPLNNTGHNSVISSSPDGNTLIVKHKYKEDGSPGGSGISKTNKTKNGWEIPKAIEIIGYQNKNKYVSNFISSDRNYLIMAIEMDDSFGEQDIYVSFKINDTIYSKPMNLGPTINTFSGDFNPFLASDNTTLYFASRGHPGFGKADIWMSRRLDDTWKNWTKPVNLGNKINTTYDEMSFTISADGQYAYMYLYLKKEGGNSDSDIARVQIPINARPEPVILVYGKVINSETNEPIEAQIDYYDLTDNKRYGEAISDPNTGEYKIILPRGVNYGFKSFADNFVSISENLDATELDKYVEIERDLYLTPFQVGKSFRLNNLFFDFGKSDLRKESQSELENLLSIIKSSPSMKIEIEGHTDNVGSASSNLQLSKDRAKAVVDWLIGKGIAKNRLQFKGYGKSKPVADNETNEGRQRNRRVEFRIIEN